MQITDELIDHLSKLAKLRFKGQEREEIKKDLGKILEFVDQLNAVETKDTEPLIHLTQGAAVWREDEPQVQIKKEEALSNAPQADSDYFKVPRFVENTEDA